MSHGRRDGSRDGATATESASGAPASHSRCFGLLWVSPEQRFTPLADGQLFGRGAGCDVCIRGDGVSRRHARIRREGPLFVLEDLESKNGSYVNGTRSPLSPVGEQSVVRIGDWIAVACALPHDFDTTGDLFREQAPGWLAGPPTLARLSHVVDLARRPVSIVLEGETGTGKEVMARSIHGFSGRTGRFVALNCGAIPESVAEAELFGHTKGAFTGALHEHEGFIAAADRGTLFLDEVGDLPASIQAKLLRAIEERAVTPLGSTRVNRIDFRLVTATQEPLAALVERGIFRPDLHARIGTAEIHLPPLRERREDVLALFQHAFA
ncbi:MAG TPA: sigma-54-dependent Fis family transcriptional regulator, partial [Polyangiaceae bacterium]